MEAVIPYCYVIHDYDIKWKIRAKNPFKTKGDSLLKYGIDEREQTFRPMLRQKESIDGSTAEYGHNWSLQTAFRQFANFYH